MAAKETMEVKKKKRPKYISAGCGKEFENFLDCNKVLIV